MTINSSRLAAHIRRQPALEGMRQRLDMHRPLAGNGDVVPAGQADLHAGHLDRLQLGELR